MEIAAAYDLKLLGEKLKGKGLDLAEETLNILVEEMASWCVECAAKSATPYDDIVAIVMPQVKKYALEQVDKIDGEVG